MIMTSSTIPSVMQVVPFPLLDTLDRCFLDTFVPARFSASSQLDKNIVLNLAYSLKPLWNRQGAISHLPANWRNEQHSISNGATSVISIQTASRVRHAHPQVDPLILRVAERIPFQVLSHLTNCPSHSPLSSPAGI